MESTDFFSHIENLREHCEHDTFIVAGQLQEDNIDPIDSWTLFIWFQEHNIPSKYILKENDYFYINTVKDHYTKDIIVIKELNDGFALLDYPEIWAKACAFIVEWDLGGTEVDRWLFQLTDCRYVFLQHGIIGVTYNNTVLYPCHNIYNDVNVSSQKEKDIIEQGYDYGRCFIAGLPRFSLLSKNKKKTSQGTRYVLVMFTWRDTFVKNTSLLNDSAYLHGLETLFSDANTKRLKEKGIKLVAAVHHSLIKKVQNNNNTINGIHFIKQEEISQWIQKTDAMVTDFSSASFDFLYQEKPVIYWIPDKEESIYKGNKHDSERISNAIKLRYNFYNTVDNAEEVINSLIKYADKDFALSEEEKEKAAQWFLYNGNQPEHIYHNICERLVLERYYSQHTQVKLSITKENLQKEKEKNKELSIALTDERQAHLYFEEREKNALEEIKRLENDIYNIEKRSSRKITNLRKKVGICVIIAIVTFTLLVISILNFIVK